MKKSRSATPEEIAELIELQNAAELARGAADQAYRALRAACGQSPGLQLDAMTGAWLEPPQLQAARAQQQQPKNGAGVALP